jgi:NDP-sugar pyrophosphorylase family protein
MTYQVIIPMTGVGQRFVDAGYREIKPLIRVGGKSILEHVLKMFPGATRVICIVSKDHNQKDALIAEIKRIRTDATVVEIAKHKLGPGHAVLEAKNKIDPNLPTLVSYCDWAGSWSPTEMISQLKDASGSILTYTGFHPHMLRNTKFAYVRKQDEIVVDIQEKNPFTDSPMQEEASAGCYGFSSGLLLIQALEKQIELNESLNGEFYLSLSYKNLLLNGHKIKTVLMEKFFQWGTPEDLQDWEYWNSSINALPGTPPEKIEGHNVVLAAGRGSRLSGVSRESKPNILVEGQRLWEYSAPPELKFRSNRVLTRPEVDLITREDVQDISVLSLTEGQAISAKIAIETIEDPGAYRLNVMSSDNAFTPEVFQEIEKLSESNQLVVWTAKKYPPSQLNPTHYSWINLEQKKIIKKKTPPNFSDWELVVGNFSFSNCQLALTLIDELVSKNIRVNGEFYLDSVIDIALTNGFTVATLAVNNFFALGTPEELLTYRYFSEIQT